LHAAEDIYCGNTASTCDTATFDDPTYFAVGGGTGFESWGGYGLGAYSVYFANTDVDGAGQTAIVGGSNDWIAETEGNTTHFSALAANNIAISVSTDVADGEGSFASTPAIFVTHACFTVSATTND